MKNCCGIIPSLALAAALTFAAGTTAPRVHAQAASTAFDVKDFGLHDIQDMDKKFVDLAQAIPAEKYSWRPGDGVRSVGEVFMHVAQMNYMFPNMMGAPAAPAFSPKGFEKSAMDKDKVVEILKQSVAYSESSIKNLSDADLQKEMKMFGRTVPGYAMLLNQAGDLHEHLGQAIAYARINSVVPPWTAARQAKQSGGH